MQSREYRSGKVISREDVIELVYEALRRPIPNTFSGTFELATNLVDQMPFIELKHDTETMKIAHWKECEVFDNVDYEISQWQSAKCSNCGKYHTTPYQYYFDTFSYCPNCGSKMENKHND